MVLLALGCLGARTARLGTLLELGEKSSLLLLGAGAAAAVSVATALALIG